MKSKVISAPFLSAQLANCLNNVKFFHIVSLSDRSLSVSQKSSCFLVTGLITPVRDTDRADISQNLPLCHLLMATRKVTVSTGLMQFNVNFFIIVEIDPSYL